MMKRIIAKRPLALLKNGIRDMYESILHDFAGGSGVRSIIMDMSATTLSAYTAPAGVARPLNILRDLAGVADLVETCFSATMDLDARIQIEQMRRNARDTHFLSWAPRVVDTLSLPLSGFVWESDGKIVGNVSLIPFHKWGRSIYLIANVATHPNYRRGGIGRTLTSMAMQRALERGADEIWLHVREDNPGAIKLYQGLGFIEKARRTTWKTMDTIGGRFSPVQTPDDFKISIRKDKNWEWQKKWLERSYPSALGWYGEQRSWSSFAPTIWNSLYHLITDTDLIHWSAWHAKQLQGVLTCLRSYGRSDQLWLACPPRPNPDVISHLLMHARNASGFSRSLSLEFPAGPMDEAIRAAGFHLHRTLLWMQFTTK